MALSGTAGQAGAGKTGGAKCEVAPGSGAPLVSQFRWTFPPRCNRGKSFHALQCQVSFGEGGALAPTLELPSSLSAAHFYCNLSAGQRRGRDGGGGRGIKIKLAV